MVQMHREAVYRRTRALQRSLLGLFQFALMSSIIPMLFILRFSLKGGFLPSSFLKPSSMGGLSSSGSSSLHHFPQQQQQQQQPPGFMETFAFIDSIDLSVESALWSMSDVVELYHCNLVDLDWTNFSHWAYPLLNQTMEAVANDPQLGLYLSTTGSSTSSVGAGGGGVDNPNNNNKPVVHPQQPLVAAAAAAMFQKTALTEMRQEFVLQLLEQYATDLQLCDFALYRPTVHGHEQVSVRLQELRDHPPSVDEEERANADDDTKQVVPPPPGLLLGNPAATDGNGRIRLVVIIVAFHDAEQVGALVDAIILPDHYIIIHLERRCSPEYKRQVLNVAESYPNVFVVQFGTISYKTDSVSRVNLRIIRWLTLDLELSFDYLLTLDGASFPFVSPRELVARLVETETDVWLGALMHKGKPVADQPADVLLRHKRLWVTRGSYPKLIKRLPLSTSRTQLSEAIQNSMKYKTTSGNQAIYSHHVIHQLLASDTVMEIFALSKYGCCCCLEEHNWIAALTVIGFEKEALAHTSMFQLWGGKEECQSSMSNAVLLRNASLCYRIEDPGREDKRSMYFRGNELWSHLESARDRGFMFCRKFVSTSDESQLLMNDIQTDLWDSDR